MGYDDDFLGPCQPFGEVVYICLVYNFAQHNELMLVFLLRAGKST